MIIIRRTPFNREWDFLTVAVKDECFRKLVRHKSIRTGRLFK